MFLVYSLWVFKMVKKNIPHKWSKELYGVNFRICVNCGIRDNHPLAQYNCKRGEK